MKNKCFVAHNAGLGDHILLNGAVRYLASIYEEVHLLVYRNRHANVQYMFRDDPQIILIPEKAADNKMQANKKIKRFSKHFLRAGNFDLRTCYWGYMADWPSLLIRVGLDPSKNCWCEGFYRCLGVDYYERYKSWKFVRDHERENNLCERLNLPDKYAFVVNRYGGKRKKAFCLEIQSQSHYDGLPHVNPARFVKSTLIFDWMKVIENATEIHVVDTAWMHLIKNMMLKQPKFLWRKARHVPASDANYLNDKYNTGWTDVLHH